MGYGGAPSSRTVTVSALFFLRSIELNYQFYLQGPEALTHSSAAESKND